MDIHLPFRLMLKRDGGQEQVHHHQWPLPGYKEARSVPSGRVVGTTQACVHMLAQDALPTWPLAQRL
ncbi:hypothetical protein MUK42_07456 [Musa troglodytarum]|uniref:Uncharacterized protein n=1 Tax=Musa troglodytarum TaxID=320322 RepID=A0A9E7JV47_9LILI|nr:hypothetical protein MUK42_07456 [Musa troglodytarum]